MSVLIGFEIGTGAPVEIPLRHMVVTGQTQEAGKTTTLEALVGRAGQKVKALAFTTKRGEGAFGAGVRQIHPYFKEEANWQFVASILEASRGEKLKFERAWIIRASKGAKTLADVQRNVRKAMETAKGMSADVYLTLDAYLDAVVPYIDKVQWNPVVDLAPGLNVMDLTGLNVEMQHLVIRSSLEWVLHEESDTIVVVPEAWKFIPQGRGTPVKLAAESYIRQAAGLGNYLWLDSQDIAGVDKLILKSVAVWILGVQRESNEIKRTLAQIPAGMKKPKPEEIAHLGLGQFFVCYGSHTKAVYVQPKWMPREDACLIAQGKKPVHAAPRPPLALRPGFVVEVDETMPPGEVHMRQGARTLARIINAAPSHDPPSQDPTVNESEARQLREENERLRNLLEERGRSPAPVIAVTREVPLNLTPDEEHFFQRVKARLIAEAVASPAVLRVLVTKPELDVEVERKTVNVDGSTWLGGVAQLIVDGFFDDPATSSAAHTELKRRGFSGIPARAYEALEKLNGMGFVTSEGKGVGYKAVPGMKININGQTKRGR